MKKNPSNIYLITYPTNSKRLIKMNVNKIGKIKLYKQEGLGKIKVTKLFANESGI